MHALVYNGPSQKTLQERSKPSIKSPTDAIVRVTRTTICGTDLHLRKGDVPSCKPGTILGHEGVGVIDAVGAGVTTFKVGDNCGRTTSRSPPAWSYCRPLSCTGRPRSWFSRPARCLPLIGASPSAWRRRSCFLKMAASSSSLCLDVCARAHSYRQAEVIEYEHTRT